MKLYRCFPYNPSAKKSEPGHPLFIPVSRGTGRINNPDIYQSSYWSAQPECAVAEVFGSSAEWNSSTFLGLPQVRESHQALVTVEFPESINLFDMDDSKNLTKLKLRPSRVVTRNNQVTQAWARRIYDENKYDGVSWWSIWWPDWQSVGLWSLKSVKLIDIEELHVNHHAVNSAADVLNKRVFK